MGLPKTVLQRLVAAGSCIVFYILTIGLPVAHGGETGLLILLALLACIEKLCAIMNLISVERDWVNRTYIYTLQGGSLILVGCRCCPEGSSGVERSVDIVLCCPSC